MLVGLVGRRVKNEFAQLLWQTECKEEDAIQWGSDVAEREKIYIQAILLGEENKVIWGEFTPQYKQCTLYHVPIEKRANFSRECQNCTFYFGAFSINCALHPQGLCAKECIDYSAFAE